MSFGRVVCLGLLVVGVVAPVAAPQGRGVAATIRVVQVGNVLARESRADADMTSSTFGTPVRTADGVFGSGGPFAM